MVVSLVTLHATEACRAYGFGTHTGALGSQSLSEICDFKTRGLSPASPLIINK